MKSKGRPKQAIIQEKSVGFFVTWKQYAIIQKMAKEAHLTISDLMRKSVLEAVIKPRWTEEERGMVKRLIVFSADLHRLIEYAGEQGALEKEDLIFQCREILDSIFKELCHVR